MGEAQTNPNDSLVGSVLDGKYEILERIGAGGMGAVYKARHVMIERIVAIKVIHASLIDTDDDLLLRRFEQEARISSRIEHPNAITIHDFGMSDGIPFLVMQFVEGETLREEIQKVGAFGVQRSYGILLQVAAALEAAHAVGVVHRDLKPDNIMLSSRSQVLSTRIAAESDEPEIDWVEVLDFGIAKLLTEEVDANSGLTLAGRMIGTPHYLAPEQASSGEIDARTDVYALGVVLYEMLSGQTPYESDSVAELLIKKISEKPRDFPPEITSSVSAAVQKVVYRALEQDPALRPQSAKELAEELTLALHQPAETVKPVLSGGASLGTVGALACAVLGILGAAFYFYSKSDSVQSPSAQEVAGAVEEEEEQFLVPLKGSDTGVSFPLPTAEVKEEEKAAVSNAPEAAPSPEAESPKSAESLGLELYEQALGALKRKDDDSAYSLLSQAIAYYPNHAASHEMLAGILLRRGQADEGVRELSISLRLDSRSVSALILLAEHLESKGELKRAITAYEAAVRVDPSREGVHRKLATLYEKRGQNRKAKLAFRKELAVNTDDVSSNLALAKTAMAAKDWKEAILRYRAVLKKDAQSAEAFLNLGLAYNKLGRFFEGVSVSEQAVALNPSNASAHNTLALSYQAVGKIERALSSFEKAIELAPENDQYRVNLKTLETRAAELREENEPKSSWSLF